MSTFNYLATDFRTLFSSDLVIVKPLPKETYLMPGKDLNMSITVNASIAEGDDITLSFGHSSRGIYQDLTKHLIYNIYEEKNGDEGEERENYRLWSIDMVLPYPYSQASGDFILSVGDNYSGDFTATRVIIRHGGEGEPPLFDPLPKSVKAYIGEDLFVNTQAFGSEPLKVSI